MPDRRRRSWASIGITSLVLLASLSGASGAAAAAPERESAGGEVIAVGEDLTIELPGTATNAEVDVDGLPPELFRGDGPALLSTQVEGAMLSSYATPSGIQTVISITSAESAKEYRFSLGLPSGAHATVVGDGSVSLLTEDGSKIGEFRAPWALDANGEAVATSFSVEGNDLVQTVNFTPNTAFPVVADPDLGVEWWGYFVRLTRAETRHAAQIVANNQGPWALAGVVCGALPGWPATVGCGSAIVLAYYRIIDPLNRANSSGRCAALNYPWLALSNPQIGWTSIHVTTVNCRR